MIPILWAAIIRQASATVVWRWSMKRKPWRMSWRSVFMAHPQGVRSLTNSKIVPSDVPEQRVTRHGLCGSGTTSARLSQRERRRKAKHCDEACEH
jgi:hypothetical protein